jgi:geranylgeranyl diphosphate synthase type II
MLEQVESGAGHVEEVPCVQDRLDRHFDDVRIRAGRFGDADEIVDALRDASSGGKFVRPELVLLVHSALHGKERAAAIDVAAAFELLHTAFVIHDDIIDRDWSRRGRANVGGRYRAKAAAAGVRGDDASHYGSSAAVIAGDLALAGALRMVAAVKIDDSRRDQLLLILDDAVVASAIGELADVELPHGAPVSIDEIARTHRAKTAVYTFEAPLQAGAVLAGAPDSVVDLLGVFGRHVGTAYQMLDDIAGVLGDERETGKEAGGDVRSAKQTAVSVFAQSGAGWPELRQFFGKVDLSPAELAHVREVLRDDGVFTAVEHQAELHLSAARSAVDKMTVELGRALLPMLEMVARCVQQTVGSMVSREESR